MNIYQRQGHLHAGQRGSQFMRDGVNKIFLQLIQFLKLGNLGLRPLIKMCLSDPNGTLIGHVLC